MIGMLGPAAVFFAAFFILPMFRLFLVGGSGASGWGAYMAIVTNHGYFSSLLATFGVALLTTLVSLLIGSIVGVFLQRHHFPGRGALVALITLPMAFPGVVVGFMVIMLAGRQGLISQLSMALGGGRVVFAYSLVGLFLGYLYFSLPRTILTVMAATEKLDPKLEEAARSLGAGPWHIVRDVILPGLKPALISAGAICFAMRLAHLVLLLPWRPASMCCRW